MKEHIIAFKTEFQRFLEQSAALPDEITALYTVCDCLHESNDKSVYLVRAKSDGRRFILKAADKRCKQDLETEYGLLGMLSGAAFPRAVFFCEDGTHKYLIREYIEGVTLAEHVERHGVFSEEAAAQIACSLSEALEQLHALDPPVIHRDIKPQNIVLTPENTCAVIDFGTARRYHNGTEKDTVCMGSEITAAPEQFGYRQTDVRSDIYALGVLVLYLCTGSFDLQQCDTIQNKRLAAIIRRCTRFDPADRYATLRHVRLRLKRIERNKPFVRAAFACGLVLGLALGAALTLLSVGSVTQRADTAQSDTIQSNALQSDTGRIAEQTVEEDPQPVTFQSDLIASAVRQELGIDETAPIFEDDLDRVTQLLITGNSVFSGNLYDYTWSALYVTPAETGTIFTLDDILKLKNLTTLGLAGQQITDISVLAQTNIVTLVLCDNKIMDLSPLSGMKCLSELYLSDNPISDIEALRETPTLTLLDISDTFVTDLSPLAGSKIQTLYLFHTPVQDYSVLSGLSWLQALHASRLDADGIAVCCRLNQLEALTLSDSPALSSLDALTGMTGLLFLDIAGDAVATLDGVECFQNLTYLCMTGTLITDLSPLTSLSSITGVHIAGLSIDDYSVLLQIPSLERVYCLAQQKEIIEQIPGGESLNFIIS